MTIMAEWNEKSLGEIAEVTKLAGFEFTKYIKYDDDGEIIALRALNLRNGELDLSDIKRISKKVSEGLTRSKIYKDDILLTYTGNGYGDCAIIEENDKYHLAPNICKIVPNQDVVFPYYLYCYIRSNAFYNQMSSNMTGSGQPTIPMKTIRLLKIPVPDMSVQIKIANVIWSLNQKIRNNKVINNNLEQQAMALFKSWFIDFEPFNRQVPKTWINGVLGDFVEIKRGGSPRPIQDFLSDSGFHWLKISDATGISSPFINEIKEYIIEAGLKKTVYLKSGSLVLSNSATPGLPKILDIDTCIHDGWLYFPSSKFSNEYLYLYFKHIRDNLIALGNGSVFTNLKTDILKNYPTYLPTEDVLKKFDELVQPIFSMILSKTREIKRLAEIRDTLLPKLMSGELDVSDIEL